MRPGRAFRCVCVYVCAKNAASQVAVDCQIRMLTPCQVEATDRLVGWRRRPRTRATALTRCGGLFEYKGGLKLAGLVSFGIGCGRDGYPGVYTELAAYLPWVCSVIHESGDHDSPFCVGVERSMQGLENGSVPVESRSVALNGSSPLSLEFPLSATAYERRASASQLGRRLGQRRLADRKRDGAYGADCGRSRSCATLQRDVAEQA